MPNGKLQPGFTARIIELIKGTQIQTAPHKTALPLGLSAAGGVIILFLSLSIPQSPLYPVGEWLGGPLPLKTRVVDDGEIAVDPEAAQVVILGGEQKDGSFGQKPERRELPTGTGQLNPRRKRIYHKGAYIFPMMSILVRISNFRPTGRRWCTLA